MEPSIISMGVVRIIKRISKKGENMMMSETLMIKTILSLIKTPFKLFLLFLDLGILTYLNLYS